jgi:hypothetical protein
VTVKTLTPRFEEYIPADPEPGHLHISLRYATAVHLCACGCRRKVVTPLKPTGWRLIFDGTVSLDPSIGNGQYPCRSHYYIRSNRVEWLPKVKRGSPDAWWDSPGLSRAAAARPSGAAAGWLRAVRRWIRVLPGSGPHQ